MTAREHGKTSYQRVLEIVFLVILMLYPLRHVTFGGDFWDVGYNYGNFAFFSEQALGKTWFFSTYLASAIGHVLTLLPAGRTVVGMNVYTGLFASLLSALGYVFSTRHLKVSPVAAFVGEFLALGACWCPTALLYNYLTYVLLLACVWFLFQGLTTKKTWMLVAAGACLGLNVFVRFSNLPEMGLILAVWAYALWEGFEHRAEDPKWFGKAFGALLKYTLWCLVGYLGALAIGFGWIALRYGISDYVTGIQGLFAMTETATDYQALSMIKGLFWPFKDGIYWVTHIGFFGALAFVIGTLIDVIAGKLGKDREGRAKARKVGELLTILISVACSVAMVLWLFRRTESLGNFASFRYSSYDSFYWPCTLLWMITLGIGFLEMILPKNAKEKRMYGLMIILVAFLTSLGSNNGIYPSLNNLFALAPYVLQKAADYTVFLLGLRKDKGKKHVALNFLPACLFGWTLVALIAMQVSLFGAYFVFCEGTGVTNATAKVTGNKALQGLKMTEERAHALQGLSDFIAKEELGGSEVILHGQIPAMAFYMDLKPAFHSWNDLASYDIETMRRTINDLKKERIKPLSSEKPPLVIAEKNYAAYGPYFPSSYFVEGETEVLRLLPEDEKWTLVQIYMGELHYEKCYENEKFVVWMAK
ncbi:MAG: hypothetical protein K5678_00015 [Acetatifactor sp.]|nr:hypothetical protein [Acetatifactor sp.]